MSATSLDKATQDWMDDVKYAVELTADLLRARKTAEKDILDQLMKAETFTLGERKAIWSAAQERARTAGSN